MGLDIRLPIGVIFILYGGILIAFGLVADPAIFDRSLGLNIDLWWGGAMVLFGLFMGSLALRASRKSRP